jgi:Cu2+-exporting ATPase
LEAKSEHPLAKAILAECKDAYINFSEAEEFAAVFGKGVQGRIGGRRSYGGSGDYVFSHVAKDSVWEQRAKDLATQGKTPLFFATEDGFAGLIAVADTIKEDSAKAIAEMKRMGIHVVMITGDRKETANAIGAAAGVDEVVAEVLPEGKDAIIQKLQNYGKVAMVGDGINDAPALSAADVGIAIEGSSSIASDTADIVLSEGGLNNVATTRVLSQGLIQKINQNNAFIIEVNSALLLLGVFGLISPQLAAILHNSVTVGISVKAMENIL